ncbi:MAG: hypothetical protein KDA25_08115, partial [Phycisphaerales bacterium]|nr:hypothetical protein [Phycisphaerales bacterium]
MPDSTPTPVRAGVTRREFVKTTALVAGASTSLFAAGAVHAAGSGAVRVGLIGCGGRGTGAAFNALEASPDVQIVALADVFRDRLDDAREKLATQGERAAVRDERCFVGFDAYA